MTTAEAAAAARPASPPSKAALSSWWERFKKKDKAEKEPQEIFGVSLAKSINYANVAISLTDANGEQFIYGYVPVVVAKCGVFLKDKATDVQGIFRLNGSTKRIKDLQTIFNSPDKYGKGLDWTGYTVHDAANVLRRYLNQLPEPIIPLEAYASFREPLANNWPQAEAIAQYQKLISELPPLSRQLLLYVLDLLAVFASKSDVNLMDAQNLAAIFQPGLISHPTHDMAPSEYLLSQKVLVFLITHQDHFLMGMRGVNDEPGGPEQPGGPHTSLKHSRTVTGVARTPSNASSGAEEIRRLGGGLRRNVSVNSKKSGSSLAASGGISRSNTLPSKRPPRNMPNPVFRPTDGSSSPKSTGTTTTVSAGTTNPAPRIQAAENTNNATSAAGRRASGSPSSRKVSGSSVATAKDILSPTRADPSPRAHKFSLSPQNDPTRPLNKPNKLRKKRVPGSNNHSADSSTTSLPPVPSSAVDPPLNVPPLETVPGSPPGSQNNSMTRRPNASFPQQISTASTSAPGHSTLMPMMSPTPSATSSVTSHSSTHSYSDANTNNSTDKKHKKTRSRWRWSNGKLDNPPLSPTFNGPASSNGSLAERLRQESRSPPAVGTRNDAAIYMSSEDEGKGGKKPFGWLVKRGQRKASSSHDESDRERVASPPPPMQLQQLPPPQVAAPGSPQIQPPTPLSQKTPKAEERTPIAEALSSDTGSSPGTRTPRQSTVISDSTILPESPLGVPANNSTSDETIIPAKPEKTNEAAQTARPVGESPPRVDSGHAQEVTEALDAGAGSER